MTITIAGRAIDAPLQELRDYATCHTLTVREYDLATDDCGPNEVCATEIRRTRRIRSRISNRQADEMLRVLADAPWVAVPSTGELADADPDTHGGLYDAMLAIYAPLLDVPGVSHAKASKLLHLKRPALFPILDSKLMGLYREAATAAAHRHPWRGGRRLYWAAIREDVMNNRSSLKQLREDLRGQGGILEQMATLSDVRLLDILAWRS